MPTFSVTTLTELNDVSLLGPGAAPATLRVMNTTSLSRIHAVFLGPLTHRKKFFPILHHRHFVFTQSITFPRQNFISPPAPKEVESSFWWNQFCTEQLASH